MPSARGCPCRVRSYQSGRANLDETAPSGVGRRLSGVPRETSGAMTEHVSWTPITPKVLADPAARRLLRACARQLARLSANDATAPIIAQIRSGAALQARGLRAAIAPEVVLCTSVLCDL